MIKYKIYYGLGGSFGGAQYQYTDEFNSKAEAEEQAYIDACEEYDNMSGLHGLRSWLECQEEAEQDFGDITEDNQSQLDDLTEQIYNEERESWLDYYVEEWTEENDE